MIDPEETLPQESSELDGPAARPGQAVAETPKKPERETADRTVGERIGPYRILRQIGEGGMGAVYLAEREDHFKQRVALKMIHPEEATDEALQCFYSERQILADLDHPHIARIFDGGATQGTLPFFVMEHIEGERFDRACADLPLVDRLKLFQKVCAAIHYAHRSLIVHCDLKPSNILVTAEGEPKLLDFGIAKLLRQGATESDSESRPGPGPMSLAFASPEQLNGDPITIGTDVYSLGVLLYKILCGRHPHYRPKISTPDLIEAIRHGTPPRPSEQVDGRDARRLAGDLDAIALKALSQAPEDRYDSAAQLAEEIQLHLDDQPVRAWPGTRLERLRKSARRNKWALAFTVLILTFSVFVTGLWRDAVGQRREAERAQIQAERTRDFIVDFFKSLEPDRSAGQDIDLKKLLNNGRRKLEQDLHGEPAIRADLLGTLATVYHGLALYDEALQLQEEALEYRRRSEPEDTRSLAVDLNNLAGSYYSRKEYEKAEALFRESLPLWKRLEDAYEPNALSNLAAALSAQNKIREALESYGLALEQSATLALDNHPNTASIHYGLGALHKKLNELLEAERHLRRALRVYSLDPQTKPSRIAQVQSSLGEVLHDLGRHPEARPYLEEALATRLRLFGALHPRTAGSQKKLALLLLDLQEIDAAESLLKQAGSTYSTLRDESGAAEIKEALARLAGRAATSAGEP